MKNIDTKTAQGGAPQGEPMRLEFIHQGARTVCVAGAFNGWNPEATPMIPWGDGRWLKELVLPPGAYEYCLVVDGNWVADSLAKAMVPNQLWQTELSLEGGQCA
jgi:hypothetical protein